MKNARTASALLLFASGFCSAAYAGQACDISGFTVTLNGDFSGFDTELDCERLGPGLHKATILLTTETPQKAPEFSLDWSLPSVDIAGIWTPVFNETTVIPPDWSEQHLESTLTRQAPVVTLFGHDDGNRLTFAVSDATNHLKLAARIREEDARIYATVEFFSQPHPNITHYAAEIRFDTADRPFHRSVSAVADWWAAMPEYAPARVPRSAREPMYSTWYSYHQQIDAQSLLGEVEKARELGFGAIIVDDGWQTMDGNRGYAFTGDWKPERLIEIRQFVDAVHARGMKALLWYSLPFVGEQSDAAAMFDGKYLSHRESLGAYVLDPRYSEVRRFLIDHYVNAVQTWGWDGLKLDFIDQFRSDDQTVLTAEDGRDHASVYAAVDTLMTDVISELRAVNPDVMVEFRQRYTGPAMRKYGNMFRATDIPNGAVTNRFRIVNLRFTSGETAVHSDMLMWHPDEPAETAALQFLNILFSVPQVSVRLTESPAPQLAMLRHYTDYWNANATVLLDGEFAAFGVTERYPMLHSTLGDRRIVGLYADHVVRLDDERLSSIDVVNAKASRSVVVDAVSLEGSFDVVIHDCFGRLETRTVVEFKNDVHRFSVPPSGLLTMARR